MSFLNSSRRLKQPLPKIPFYCLLALELSIGALFLSLCGTLHLGVPSFSLQDFFAWCSDFLLRVQGENVSKIASLLAVQPCQFLFKVVTRLIPYPYHTGPALLKFEMPPLPLHPFSTSFKGLMASLMGGRRERTGRWAVKTTNLTQLLTFPTPSLRNTLSASLILTRDGLGWFPSLFLASRDLWTQTLRPAGRKEGGGWGSSL